MEGDLPETFVKHSISICLRIQDRKTLGNIQHQLLYASRTQGLTSYRKNAEPFIDQKRQNTRKTQAEASAEAPVVEGVDSVRVAVSACNSGVGRFRQRPRGSLFMGPSNRACHRLVSPRPSRRQTCWSCSPVPRKLRSRQRTKASAEVLAWTMHGPHQQIGPVVERLSGRSLAFGRSRHPSR